MRHSLKGIVVGIATGLLGAIFALSPLGADFEQNVGLPWLFDLRGPIEPPAEVLVVAINAATAEQMGLPSLPRDWPRTKHAELISSLSNRGASVIVFDMDFGRSRSAEDDAELARAISDAGSVILIQTVDGKTVPIEAADGSISGTVWVENLKSPVPVLSKAALGLAPFPLPKTQVAVYRFWAFKPSVGDAPTLPSLALQIHTMRQFENWFEVLQQAGVGDVAKLPETTGHLKGANEIGRVVDTLRSAVQSDPDLMARITETAQRLGDSPGNTPGLGKMAALARLYGGPDHRLLNFYGPAREHKNHPLSRGTPKT